MEGVDSLSFETIKDVVTALKIPVDKLSTNLLDKPTKELGEGVGNLFWLAFAPILCARNYLEPRIEKFKEEIGTEISKIPAENLTEPPLNIVGPALEASKYYIENDDLRLMFAKLIASSMDVSNQSSAHPSFVEVIKQMSPLDAKNLNFLLENIMGSFGVATVYMVVDDKSSKQHLYENFFPFPGLDSTNSSQYAASINNLMRLGLISIDYQRNYINKQLYHQLHNHQLMHHFENTVPFDVRLLEGVWDITDYGKSFTDCCY